MKWVLLGSLRKSVLREVKQHCRSNLALLEAKPSLPLRLLRSFFGRRVMGAFLLFYSGLVLLLVGFTRHLPSVLPAWSYDAAVEVFLRGATGYFLAAQVTMLGLLFPIAVALVTLITQREEASSTLSDIQVYYGETFAFGIGASNVGNPFATF